MSVATFQLKMISVSGIGDYSDSVAKQTNSVFKLSKWLSMCSYVIVV